MREGYDLAQLTLIQEQINIPLIASGGAGTMEDFKTAFEDTNISGALAASVFHSGKIEIPLLKQYLSEKKVEIRALI